MKFVMLGSGAVGSYFGAKLQLAGHEVVFVARGAHLRALTENGLTLCVGDDETRLFPVTATDDLATIGEADYVLIGVKSWQVDEVAQTLPLLKGPHTRFVTLQNGVEAASVVAKIVGPAQTLSGLVRGFFHMDGPGRVRHVGVQPTIIFGQHDGGHDRPAQDLMAALLAAGVHAELSDDIEAALWEKFLLVTSLSGVGAVTRSPIGEMRTFEPTRQMLGEVMAEIVAVAKSRGVHLSEDAATRTLAFVDTFPPDATTSMQRDLMAGLPSELEAQIGAVVRLGQEAGVPTPINQFIYDSLILQEMRARSVERG